MIVNGSPPPLYPVVKLLSVPSPLVPDTPTRGPTHAHMNDNVIRALTADHTIDICHIGLKYQTK